MPAIANDPTTQLAFSMFENKGVYAVLLGSGVSRSAGIPTGWEITMELVRRAGIASGVDEQDDWHAWYVSHTGQQPNYSTLLESLANTQSERRAIIQGFLEPTAQELEDGLKVPTRAHRAIAEMVKGGFVRVIVTTNFDRLMENALREAGIEPTVVGSVDTLAGAEPLTHCKCFILNIHGDYKDARILNTDVELGGYPPEYNALLDRIIDEFGLIVAGWSGEWDHALREAFLRAPSRRYPTYWLARGNISERGKQLVSHRRAVVVNASDADSFFGALDTKLETINQSRQLNPSSIELTISMAKRFLARPEHQIQLDELVSSQTRRVIADIVPYFASAVAERGEDFRDWVSTYEAAAEPLARLATVLGRWGTGNELSLIIDAVKGLYAAASKEQSGFSHWVELKNYPAALVMYGYGLGLTRANRLDVLHKVLSTQLIKADREPTVIGVELAPFFLESATGLHRYWQSTEGQDRKHTPLSNRLTEVVVPKWSPAFAGIHDPALLYERFEFLSLLYFARERDVTEDVLNEQIKEGGFKYIASGRLSWHSETINHFSQEYSTSEYKQPLLNAGFAFGSETYLQRFLEGLKRLARF